MNNTYDTQLKLMQRAAREAGGILLKYYGTNLTVEKKAEASFSPVTQADKEADAHLHDVLMSAEPTYGWLSEESEDDPARLDKEMVWVVDPLDGTKAFISNKSEFSISIGLVKNGQPVAGVVYDPLANHMMTAQKGGGVQLNGEEKKNRHQGNLADALCLTSFTERTQKLWDGYEDAFKMRNNPSMALKLAHVAVGIADFTVTLKPKCEWDTAAGHIMCEEAGLVVTDLYNKPVTYNKPDADVAGMVVAPACALDDVKEIFKLPRAPYPGY